MKLLYEISLVLFIQLALGFNISVFAQSDVASNIDNFLKTETSEYGFSGGILLIENEKVTLKKGYGLADKESNTSFSANTVFDLGSITKYFSATAILKLQDEGKLNLQDPITKYFNSVPSDKDNITIHHLLTHSAGFPGSLGRDYDPVEKDAFLEIAMNTELLSKPGAVYHYSNAGYSLLGMIIEDITDMSYDQYLHEELFDPLDMNSSGYLPKVDDSRLAHGYRNNTEEWGTPWDHNWADDGPYWHLRANGGLLTSLDDFEKWYFAYQNNRIISKDSKRKQLTKHIPENPEMSSYYGYGLAIFNLPEGNTMIGHDGSNMIFSADFQMYIDHNVSFLIVTNTHGRRLFDISNALSNYILTGELDPLPAPRKSTIKPIGFAAGHPAVKRILGFIETINESTDTEKEKFIEENMTPGMIQDMGVDELSGFMSRIHARHGTLKPEGVERGDHQFTVYSKTKDGSYLKISVDHIGGPDFLIDGFLLGMTDSIEISQ